MKKIFAIMLVLAMLLCVAAMADTTTYKNQNGTINVTYTATGYCAYSVTVPEKLAYTGLNGGDAIEFNITVTNEGTCDDSYSLKLEGTTLRDANGHTMEIILTDTNGGLDSPLTLPAGDSKTYTVKATAESIGIYPGAVFTGTQVLEISQVRY